MTEYIDKRGWKSCQPQGDELDRSFAKLEGECFRYIDGDRAQQKLFAEDGEKE